MRKQVSDNIAKQLQSKNAKQRDEITRLTRQVEALRKANAKLLSDLKWMRGKTND
jgi:hypothetical protein